MVIDSHLHVLKQENFDRTSFESLGLPFPLFSSIVHTGKGRV
ncbi:unnamed protein product [marine sediment metagenome]|uniref:Uncharacterized protein n=1 Tax=marine sediment metagenome TaxID=412755 RepID=X1NYD7_9ZZZZ